MSSYYKKLLDRYYNLSIKFFNFKNKVTLINVNFKDNWLKPIFMQKKYLVLTLITEIINEIFRTLAPFLIGFIIEKKSYIYLLYLAFAWTFNIILHYLNTYFIVMLEIPCINSIQFSAYTFFLTVDPIFHTRRSAGKLFAKIERATRAYEAFIGNLIYDIIPMFISVSIVILSFLFVDKYIGLIALLMIFLISSLNIFLSLFINSAFEPRVIEADDIFKSIIVESLMQVQLIRYCFASNEIINSAKDSNKILMSRDMTYGLSLAFMYCLTRLLYLISIVILSIYFINLINLNKISIVTASTLMITYLRSSGTLLDIGRRIGKILKSITRVKDLFSFIRSFGIKSFPVLKGDCDSDLKIINVLNENIIKIDMNDLYFEYSSEAKIFDNHSLSISVPFDQENKLYGIIGPSGSGKTTLLSILGGQLRPSLGSVILNNIDIYTIDDLTKRRLIAIQGQVATSLSGTLKSSLLIGLPQYAYHDDQLIDVLNRVGLWSIFEAKEGLDTIIGESGFSLSGGQRQRLNFASLYLRAIYYKPILILIDEPTSSLDEFSEMAITKMINYLAKKSLTIVIAHRINTLKSAVAILDFSLLNKDKNMQFYSKEDLLNASIYYKSLLDGKVDINN